MAQVYPATASRRVLSASTLKGDKVVNHQGEAGNYMRPAQIVENRLVITQPQNNGNQESKRHGYGIKKQQEQRARWNSLCTNPNHSWRLFFLLACGILLLVKVIQALGQLPRPLHSTASCSAPSSPANQRRIQTSMSCPTLTVTRFWLPTYTAIREHSLWARLPPQGRNPYPPARWIVSYRKYMI